MAFQRNKYLEKLWNGFLQTKLAQQIDWIIHHLSIPGFKGVPLIDVLRFVYIEILRDSLQTRASSIAFNVFLSFFPFIIIFFQIISLVPDGILSANWLDFLEDILPRSAYFFVTDTIEEVLKRSNTTGVISISSVLALFFASNGVSSLMTAFRKHRKLIERQRSAVRQRFVAFWLTLLLAIVIIATLLTIVFGQYFINYGLELFELSRFSYVLVLLLKWLMTFLLVLNTISIIYYFTPYIKDKWSYFSPGSILATVLCIISSLGFRWYIDAFGKYSLLYGYVGTVMVLLLWLYVNSMVLIIGFEMNLGIDVNKQKIRDPKQETLKPKS